MDAGPIPSLLAFVLTAFVIELTPGPNMAYLAVLSATSGRRAGFLALSGIATGLLIVGIIAALGVATLVSGSPAIYQTLRWAGVLYLLWLAFDTWRESGLPPCATADTDRFFYRGLLTNLLNPKVALFYIAVLPDFVDASKPVPPQTLVLSVIYVCIATFVHFCIVLLAEKAGRFFGTTASTRIQRGMAITIGIIALWFAYTTKTL